MENDLPEIIKKVGFDFDWDEKKVWNLSYPMEEIDIEELIWHFDIPFLDKEGTDEYNLTPLEVLNKKEGSRIHLEKIEEASLKYPIDIMFNKGNWLILDGLHRLMKCKMQDVKKIKVRKIPIIEIPNILKN